jgi:hypothetical protein
MIVPAQPDSLHFLRYLYSAVLVMILLLALAAETLFSARSAAREIAVVNQ